MNTVFLKLFWFPIAIVGAVFAQVFAQNVAIASPRAIGSDLEASSDTAAIASSESLDRSLQDTSSLSSATNSFINLSAEATPSSAVAESDLLVQYGLEVQDGRVGNAVGQVTSVSQLSDVQPTDWAFQALQTLVERYGVIAGYPDGTFRGNRTLTRYEFAAGLNAALERINELISEGLAETVTREDLETVQRLQDEFAAELATLRGRVDSLEARTAELEANQFSTTTKLFGDAIFAISDVFGDDDQNGTVFHDRVRLTLDSTFTDGSRLRTRLLAGNFLPFSQPGNEAAFGYAANTDNDIILDTLSYIFSVGDRADVVVYANGGSLDNLAFGNVITPFDVAAARGAVSRFGQRPPIYRVANTRAAVAVDLELTDNIRFELGYGSGEPNSPLNNAGLFNGDYAILGQLTAKNLFGRLDLGLTYVNSYVGTRTSGTNIVAGLPTGTGSIFANVDADRPVISNSYGIQTNLKISDGFQLGGWVGYSAIRALELGDADVWNYAVTLAFPDLIGEGNLGGIVVGVQPRLVGTTPALGRALGRREDPDTGLHVEAFYRWALNDYIDITPGVAWITAPNHDEDNSDIILGTLRTTFRF